MKSNELLKKLFANGWKEIRQSGSHLILRHPDKANPIIFPSHGSKEVATGTAKHIHKQAGLK